MARFALLTHPSCGVSTGSEASTGAERAQALQPALGRPTRGALFHGSQQRGTAQAFYGEFFPAIASVQRARQVSSQPVQLLVSECCDKDQGRPLSLPQLALLDALSFLALGPSSLQPILQRQDSSSQLSEPITKPIARHKLPLHIQLIPKLNQ